MVDATWIICVIVILFVLIVIVMFVTLSMFRQIDIVPVTTKPPNPTSAPVLLSWKSQSGNSNAIYGYSFYNKNGESSIVWAQSSFLSLSKSSPLMSIGVDTTNSAQGRRIYKLNNPSEIPPKEGYLQVCEITDNTTKQFADCPMSCITRNSYSSC